MIIFVILIGSALRLMFINQSLWLDESIGAYVVKTMSYWDVLTKFSIADNHPPLYYLLIKLWTSIFGYSEFSLRLPSVLFGLGIVYLVYKLTKNKFTSFLIATSPLMVYYSQEARMYMMAGFFSTLAIYAYLNKKFLIFSLSILLLIFTDYVPVFILPVFILYSIYKKESINKTILSFVPSLFVSAFWLPYFYKQVMGGRILLETFPDWRVVAGGATFNQLINVWTKFVLGRISFYDKWSYGILIAIASIPILISLFKSIKNKNLYIYWAWLVVPITLCFIASFFIPAFIYFRFIFVLPAFYILMNPKKNLIFYLLVLVNIVGLTIYFVNPRQHREDWKGAVNYVEENINSDEIVIFSNPEPFAPYMWYEKKYELSHGAIPKIPAKTDLVKNLSKDKKGIYYFEYLSKLQDPQNLVTKSIIENGFYEVDKKAFNGVGFVVHYKKQNAYAYSN